VCEGTAELLWWKLYRKLNGGGSVTSWPIAYPLESSCVAFLDFKVEHLGRLSTPPVTAHRLSGALVVDVCVMSDAITDNDARKFKTREQWVMPELRD